MVIGRRLSAVDATPTPSARAGVLASEADRACETSKPGLGLLPNITLAASLGVLLVSIAEQTSRLDLLDGQVVFWLGLVVIVAPILARQLTSSASRAERVGLLLLLGLALYLVKVTSNPQAFTFSDELTHTYNVEAILQTGHLFQPNPLVDVTALYPGLPSVGAALTSLTGLSVFQAGVAVSAIGISPQNDNVRIVGLRNGGIFATTTGANPLLNVRSASMPAKYVSRAVVDPNNPNTAYVAFSGFGIAGQQIWKTTNLNANPPTWTNAAAGLPDVPFNGFVIDPLNSNMLYAGSDIGVFVSSDGGNTWNPFGTGLPRVAVFDMAFQGPNRLVRIATHGRGAWEIAAAKAQAVVTVAASPTTSTYGDNVTLTATVASNGVLSNPTGTVTFTDGSLTLGSASLSGSAFGIMRLPHKESKYRDTKFLKESVHSVS